MTRWDIGCEEATECLEFGQKLRSVVLLPSFPVLPPAFPASCQKVFFKPFDPPRSLRGDALFASWVSERVAAKVPFSSLTSLFTTLTALCFSPSSQLVCGSHCVGGIGSKKAEESALSQAAVATVVVPPHLKSQGSSGRGAGELMGCSEGRKWGWEGEELNGGRTGLTVQSNAP